MKEEKDLDEYRNQKDSDEYKKHMEKVFRFLGGPQQYHFDRFGRSMYSGTTGKKKTFVKRKKRGKKR